ncbi:MAG: hypothetical protein LBM96_05995 [Methanobrevibacter sp.]|jgi:hypothetical protein|nr:hypothetical protein [Candidatus Methanoflexus mossambicus]
MTDLEMHIFAKSNIFEDIGINYDNFDEEEKQALDCIKGNFIYNLNACRIEIQNTGYKENQENKYIYNFENFIYKHKWISELLSYNEITEIRLKFQKLIYEL